MHSSLIKKLEEVITNSNICLKTDDCRNRKRTVICIENKTKIRFECKLDENSEILAFIIDPNFKGKCNGEENCHYNLVSEGPTCDGIIILERKTDIKVIFWELKGSGVERAINQILNSIDKFKKLFSQSIYNYKIRVVIAHTGGAPQKNKFPQLKDYKPIIRSGLGKRGLDITSYIFFED